MEKKSSDWICAILILPSDSPRSLPVASGYPLKQLVQKIIIRKIAFFILTGVIS
jgi:hypothetical protein